MTLQEMIDKWKKFASDLNEKGIPVPTIRDPKTGFGSISLTLVFISSVIVIAGIIGKSAGLLGGLNMSSAMDFFWTAVSLYFGRQFQTKSGTVFGTESKVETISVSETPPESTIVNPTETKTTAIEQKVDNPD
jgi:hypothetical protein